MNISRSYVTAPMARVASVDRYSARPVTEENYTSTIESPKIGNRLESSYQDGYVPLEPSSTVPMIGVRNANPSIPTTIDAPEPNLTTTNDEYALPNNESVGKSEDMPPLELVRGADGRLYGMVRKEQGVQKTSVDKIKKNNLKKNGEQNKRLALTTSANRNFKLKTQTFSHLRHNEYRQIRKLADKDKEVRMHEMAHAAAIGMFAGSSSPTYSYQVGPDGKQYAVAGHVNVDVSPENTPERTILKMQAIRRSATSPGRPSVKDAQTAANALMVEGRARMQIAEKNFRPIWKKNENAN